MVFTVFVDNREVTITTSDNNVNIKDSYQIKRKSSMKTMIEQIKNRVKSYCPIYRKESSLIDEWRAHNLLHTLGIMRERTGSVDLNFGIPWYISVCYWIGARLYFFIPK